MVPISPQPASNCSRGAAPASSGNGAAPRARWKRILGVLIGLSALIWLLGWLSVDESGQPVTQTVDEPQAEIEGLRSFMVRGEDGKPKWEISARRVSVAADGTSTLATGIGRAMLYRDGKPFLRLSAPLVRFSNPTSNLEASGGVSATGPNEFAFQTARALWFNASQTVECPKPVTAWLRNFYFNAPRLTYNWNQGVLRCSQRVEVRTEGAVFRGKNLEATLKTRQIKLSGGVQLLFAPSAVETVLSRSKPASR